MNHTVRHGVRWKRWGLLLWALWIASSISWCRVSGQPPQPEGKAKPAAEAKSADKADKAAPARKKPRGRLPRYYAKVVSTKQREEIYSIQSRYQKEIAALQAQIDKLVKQRDEEVSAVLTDAQRAEVAKLREAASKRRKARTTKMARAESS